MSIYLTSARILKDALLKRGTLKTLVYSSLEKDKRKLFALVCETLKHQKILTKVAEGTDLLNQYGWNKETRHQLFNIEITDELELKYLALTLLYDFLYGKGLGKAGRIRSLITKHKRIILTTFNYLKKDDILPENNCKNNRVCLPRYIRVNTLKTTKKDVLSRFQNEGWELKKDFPPDQYYDVLKNLEEYEFIEDPDIPNVLVFPPRTDFHSHYLNESGSIILQDKASCFPAYVLNPLEDSQVIDSCAAPGNKTTHLAAIMNNTGKITAFDLSKDRIVTLESFVEKAGVDNTNIRCSDFMKINPEIKGCEEIEYILVDPSCSGSGIAERRNDLTDDDKSNTKKRLRKLSNFQSLLLQHALTFPSVKRVVYSTCSIHEAENERVVDEVLRKFHKTFKLEFIMPEWRTRGKDGYNCSKYCIRLNTAEHLTNGFFVACFVPRKNKLEIYENECDIGECYDFSKDVAEEKNIDKFQENFPSESYRKKSKKKKKLKENNESLEMENEDFCHGSEHCIENSNQKPKKSKKKKKSKEKQNVESNEIETKVVNEKKHVENRCKMQNDSMENYDDSITEDNKKRKKKNTDSLDSDVCKKKKKHKRKHFQDE